MSEDKKEQLILQLQKRMSWFPRWEVREFLEYCYSQGINLEKLLETDDDGFDEILKEWRE